MRKLERDEIVAVLRQAEVAYVAVVDGDRPYVAPMSFVFIDDTVVFRTAEGRRLEALRKNPNVSLAVASVDDASGDWHSVIVSGVAVKSAGGVGSGTAVTRLVAKYRAAYGVIHMLPDWLADDGAAIVEVRIDDMSGRSTGGTERLRPGRL